MVCIKHAEYAPSGDIKHWDEYEYDASGNTVKQNMYDSEAA